MKQSHEKLKQQELVLLFHSVKKRKLDAKTGIAWEKNLWNLSKGFFRRWKKTLTRTILIAKGTLILCNSIFLLYLQTHTEFMHMSYFQQNIYPVVY